jgi:hypothetical protein
MTDTTQKKDKTAHLAPYKWKPGVSPNPLGRPKGSKNKLSEDFISALSRDFEQHGTSVIETVRTEKPADYLKIIASIVPKELTINAPTLDEMSDEELIERLEQVRSLAIALSGSQAASGSRAQGRKAKAQAVN